MKRKWLNIYSLSAVNVLISKKKAIQRDSHLISFLKKFIIFNHLAKEGAWSLRCPRAHVFLARQIIQLVGWCSKFGRARLFWGNSKMNHNSKVLLIPQFYQTSCGRFGDLCTFFVHCHHIFLKIPFFNFLTVVRSNSVWTKWVVRCGDKRFVCVLNFCIMWGSGQKKWQWGLTRVIPHIDCLKFFYPRYSFPQIRVQFFIGILKAFI